MTLFLSSATPAKVNLLLKVTGRRPDGFHELETLFYPIPEVRDTLTVEFGAPGIRLRCNLPEVPSDERNLVWRAAEAFAAAANVTPEWDIYLEKHIPVAAGLGGGSSDAAAILRLLNSHYNKLEFQELAKCAVKIGADVPFFLAPALAVAHGIGDKLLPIPDINCKLPMVLINPLFPVSAKWAYTNLDKSRIGETPEVMEKILAALAEHNVEKVAGLMHNDLEFALLEKFPLLGIIRDEMLKYNALRPMVSGSGSTMFSLCRTGNEANRLGATLREKFPEFPVFVIS